MRNRLRRTSLFLVIAFVMAFVLAVGSAGWPFFGPVGTVAAAEAATEDGAPLAGTWHGVIDIPGQPLDVKVQFSATASGEWQGAIDIPIQGAFGLKLERVEWANGWVQFAFADIPASVHAQLSADGRVMDGVFHQSGMDFPFRAEKEAAADPGKIPGAEERTATGPAGETDAGLAQFLADVRAFVLDALEQWGVPGVAVTIVQDGRVIMAEGFGLRDVERGLPVTSTTQFGIGSSTKAFTSAAFQMLVDEGALSWETPLREALPGFRLQDPFARELATALDFALHRSGLPRHDVLWMANPQLDADKVIAHADLLQPAAEFREGWIYNNFGYMLLGRLIEDAAGVPWDVFVAERLLDPLGMTGTTFTVAAMQRTGNFALPYAPGEDGPEPIPLMELGAAAAAGAMNSNAEDMAKWLIFQLKGGAAQAGQLVSPAGMARLHTPHIVIGGAQDPDIGFLSYSPGWMIDTYRGYYRVHHGGNTIGYSADVAFIPSEDVGVAVLTNGLFTPLPTIVVHYVLDGLLGLAPIDWAGRLQEAEQLRAAVLQQPSSDGEGTRRLGTVPSHALEEYAGAYEHPLYGTLQIIVADGRLRVSYYEFEGALEHWHYDQFRARLSPYLPVEFPFVFETDATGEIAKVYAGLEPSVDPIPFVRQVDVALTEREYLRRFVGEYDLMGAAVIDVSLRVDDLVLTVPGQPPYVLTPVRDGQFVFRDYEGFGVHFTVNDDGEVVKALLIQPQGNLELPRK